jgi:hypothetical protein
MACDTFGLANGRAQQRAEQGTPIQAGEGADAAANYVESHGMTNSAPNGVAKHISHPPPFKPDSWIPIEEHVLRKPQRNVKIISIGCGFSGM